MNPEQKLIEALLNVYFEYYQIYRHLGDEKYLARTHSCIEILKNHFIETTAS